MNKKQIRILKNLIRWGKNRPRSWCCNKRWRNEQTVNDVIKKYQLKTFYV